MTPEELAARGLEAAGPGVDAFATAIRERSLLLRFAASRPTQATAVEDLELELAVVRDGHVGRASTNDQAPRALTECARSALAAAEAAAHVGAGTYPGFPVPQAGRAHAGHDSATARLDPAQGGRTLAAAFEAAADAGMEAHGIWTAAEVETAVAAAGGSAVDRVTDAFMKVICIAPSGRSGYASRTAVAAGELDGTALGAQAAAKASASGEPARLPAGEYPVVMEAHAVGWLLDLLAVTALNGLAHVEGRGALADRLGRQVAAPAINLSDSPASPQTLPRGMDAEGAIKRPLPLIEDGVAKRVVHDTRSGALAGEPSTGHALRAGGAPGGPRATNLVLAGGGAADLTELCAPIERGVYVTRLWYANVVRPRESLITAVTRDGTFLIEDGRIARPLADLRLTDSVLGILGRTQALAQRQVLASDGEFYGRRFAAGVVCPALRAGSVRFTGSA
ncbi:MAG TPA: metallopeptidase TldD-related protein [Thermoleophilaceae bacterium]|nr:metallopeptidase TldD-related protein [Thermoleophilaceae bacterium]